VLNVASGEHPGPPVRATIETVLQGDGTLNAVAQAAPQVEFQPRVATEVRLRTG